MNSDINNNSKHNKIIKGLFYIIFFVCLFFAFFYGLTFKIVNDGFWHIKVGEYIIKNLTIPYNDIFSWYGKSMNLKWISHEWLFGVVAYLVYSIHGFTSVAIFIGIVNTLTCVLLYLLIKMRSKSSWVSLICISLYLVTLYNDVGLAFRPITVSMVIILTLCILLERKKYLIGLIVLIIGVNVHGGIYPIYLIIFAYYTLFKNYKFFIASLFCILINPYTYNIYMYTINAMKEMSVEKTYINEWKVTALYDYKASLVIVIFMVFIYAYNRVKLKDILFSGSIILLAFSSNRQIIFLSIIALPMVSPYILGGIEKLIDNFPKDIYVLKPLRDVVTKQSVKVVIFIFIQAVLIFPNIFYTYNFVSNKMTLFTVDSADYPIYAANYINSHPKVKSSRLLSHYNDSPYLIFRGIPTFVDSRADLFLPSYNKNTNAFYDFMRGFVDHYEPQELISKYKIEYILVNKSYSIYDILNTYKNLSVVYEDENYCIYKVDYFQ
ncbi:hypothetical protein [Clostridium akagii]|uniref:hypothetical protein n=1 Tax=Clostridium akagii TaxID=91623 RepID=UPI000478EED6|nr:hypothetical protein [Clostridium akagii]